MTDRRAILAAARRLARQGTAERLWEMADYMALRGQRRYEEEYRAAARLREATERNQHEAVSDR